MKDKIIDGHAISLIPARDRLLMTIDFLTRVHGATKDINGPIVGSAIKAAAKDKKVRQEYIATVDEMEAVVTLYKGIQIFIDRMMKDCRDLTDKEKHLMGIITENTYLKRAGEDARVTETVEDKQAHCVLLENGPEIIET